MRDLQARMLSAVLEGAGLRGIAELAASEVGGPVAIVLPARGLSAAAPVGEPPAELVDRVRGQLAQGQVGQGADGPVPGPAAGGPVALVETKVPVLVGGEAIGAVVALSANGSAPAPGLKLDRTAVLSAAAVATLAEVAATEARDRVAEDLRGGVLEDLRRGGVVADDLLRRAARLGCRLDRGAVILAAEVRSGKPRFAAALVAGEWEGALAEPLDGERLYALLPGGEGSDAASRTLEAARALAKRLASHGPAAFSSYCSDPAELGRALREAELALEVVARDERLAEQLQDGIGEGVYRLLFRALASSPDEVHSFYQDTVAALVEHDREYRTDLLGTLESYLANDCNMNSTARAVFAHRHTVAHRLERIRELTGLDPGAGEDRERLGLGSKAYRILAPTLPR